MSNIDGTVCHAAYFDDVPHSIIVLAEHCNGVIIGMNPRAISAGSLNAAIVRIRQYSYKILGYALRDQRMIVVLEEIK